MQRHLADKPRVHVGERRVDGVVAGVVFGRGGDGERRFGKNDARFGHADHGHCLRRGYGDLQDLRGGHADFLGCGDHDASCDEARVFPRAQHAGQIMHGGVRIGASHGFDER